MTALKTIVAVMTVLLIAGFGVLVGGLIMQAKRVEPLGFGAAELRLPAGAKVLDTTVSGDRLVVRVGLEDGGQQVHVVDIHSGRVLGTIAIKRAP